MTSLHSEQESSPEKHHVSPPTHSDTVDDELGPSSKDDSVPAQVLDDPQDPLNWPNRKKYTIFAVMCYATWTGLSTTTSPLLALVVQAKTFHTTSVVTSYTVSSVLGGLLVGPIVLVPFSQIFGITSCTFWSLIGICATSIWSAKASNPNDYTSYTVSRAISGLFSAVPQVLTGGLIVDIFQLRQRGRAFAIYTTCYTMGSVSGATFCGFIIQHTGWPVTLWWTVGSNGLAAILVFLFVDDTSYDRTGRSQPYVARGWLAGRVATLFPGTKVVVKKPFVVVAKNFIAPFVIACSPVIALAGVFSLVYFAWFVLIFVATTVDLQEPYEPSAGSFGYGFTPQQNSFFFFSVWVGALLAITYGVAFNDRIPQLLARRRGNTWHPEYRLHTVWFPALITMPIGLGLYGATVKNHYHYMSLAFASFLIAFSAIAAIPAPLNYAVESFKRYPQETGAILNAYRLALSIALQFFFPNWEKQVGVNWAWGTAAFVSLAALSGVVVLVIAGSSLRTWGVGGDWGAKDEEGRKLGE